MNIMQKCSFLTWYGFSWDGTLNPFLRATGCPPLLTMIRHAERSEASCSEHFN
jgi:hypothetical protein